MNTGTFCGSIAIMLSVLLYLLSRTRIGKIKVAGWVIVISVLIPISLFLNFIAQPSDAERFGRESTKVINDLRALRSAASLFYDEHKAWPSPGQVASLDEYSDRPIVNAAPPRYARVILLERPFGEVGSVDLYVGVELLPQKNGMEKVQTRLAAKTPDIAELLQEPASDDGGLVRYKSGLNVYMKVN